MKAAVAKADRDADGDAHADVVKGDTNRNSNRDSDRQSAASIHLVSVCFLEDMGMEQQ